MIVGIDLGTTKSAIAYINKDGKPEVIPNRKADITNPSVLIFEDNREVIVRKASKDNGIIDPINVVVKSLKYFSELQLLF